MKAKEHKRPFLLLYINDFLSSVTVSVMDNDQFAWYLRLLMRAWQFDPACCLPNEDALLMMYAGCRNKKLWDSKKGLVLINFEVTEDQKFVTNWRLQSEYEKMCVINAKRKDAGNKSAAKRQQNSTSVEQKSATLTKTITVTKPKEESPASQAKADVRFPPVKEFVEKCCEHAKVPFTWDGSESSHLSRWLKANPTLDADSVIALVRARFRSGAPPGERPRKWIGDLGKFATENRNGNHGNSKQDDRTIKSRAAITNVLGDIARRDGQLPQVGSERSDSESLVRGPQRVLGSGDP